MGWSAGEPGGARLLLNPGSASRSRSRHASLPNSRSRVRAPSSASVSGAHYVVRSSAWSSSAVPSQRAILSVPSGPAVRARLSARPAASSAQRSPARCSNRAPPDLETRQPRLRQLGGGVVNDVRNATAETAWRSRAEGSRVRIPVAVSRNPLDQAGFRMRGAPVGQRAGQCAEFSSSDSGGSACAIGSGLRPSNASRPGSRRT